MGENRSATAVIAVLAGGRSRRMGGGEKALIRLGGATLLERILTAARPLGLPILVVAGTAPSPQLRAAAAAASDLGITRDRYPGQGPLGVFSPLSRPTRPSGSSPSPATCRFSPPRCSSSCSSSPRPIATPPFPRIAPASSLCAPCTAIPAGRSCGRHWPGETRGQRLCSRPAAAPAAVRGIRPPRPSRHGLRQHQHAGRPGRGRAVPGTNQAAGARKWFRN